MSHSTDSDRPRVLYVDDQVGNLTVFRASLRRHIDVRTATSATEALQILSTEEFPVVISDQRMEGMSGSELLARVRSLYPETRRVLLTAHADFPSVVQALNEGRIARFIRKPWKRQEVYEIVQQCCEEYRRERERHALAQQFLGRMSHIVLSHATAGFAAELQERVRSLDALEQLMETWGICEGQSPELDELLQGVIRTRRLAGALASHVARIERAA